MVHGSFDMKQKLSLRLKLWWMMGPRCECGLCVFWRNFGNSGGKKLLHGFADHVAIQVLDSISSMKQAFTVIGHDLGCYPILVS